MGLSRTTRRIVLGLTVVAGAAVLGGCGSPYLRQRRNDLLQVGDLGITTSKKPYLSVHACGLGLVSAGAGRLDGKFTGLGGDQVGTQDHYHRALGLVVWSYDEIGWGDKVDPKDPNTLLQWHIGPVGWLGYPKRPPSYSLACTHYLHLGFVGLMSNLRYLEMVDFLLGWTTLDIMGDDGHENGDWAWQTANPKYTPRWTPKLPY